MNDRKAPFASGGYAVNKNGSATVTLGGMEGIGTMPQMMRDTPTRGRASADVDSRSWQTMAQIYPSRCPRAPSWRKPPLQMHLVETITSRMRSRIT